LHVEQLLANVFGFFLGRKCDFCQIGHLRLLHDVAEPPFKWWISVLASDCPDMASSARLHVTNVTLEIGKGSAPAHWEKSV
jgi:hypothetical protein